MLRWLARLRLCFPPLTLCRNCYVLEVLRTSLGIRCAVGSAGVAGYGCVWHSNAWALYAKCVHTPLYTRGVAYGCIRSLSFSFMV